MNLEERNNCMDRVNKYDRLTDYVKSLEKFSEQLARGGSLVRIEMFGVMGGSREIPKINNLDERIKKIIEDEVDNEIKKINKEIDEI